MRKVLITGANGFVGRHLVSALQSAGDDVVCLVRSAKGGNEVTIGETTINLTDRDSLEEALRYEAPSHVVHLARASPGRTELNKFWAEYEINIRLSLDFIRACQTLSGLRRFVSLGSCEEYGPITTPYDEASTERPVSAYGLSKLTVTLLLRTLSCMSSFPSVILRPSVVYGPSQPPSMLVPAMILSLLQGEAFALTAGAQTRDFIYVDDLIEAILLALEQPKAVGQTLNIASGQSISIYKLACLVAGHIGPTADQLLRFGLLPYRQNEVMNYHVSRALADTILGWRPQTSLSDGLSRTVDHFAQFRASP